MTIFLLFLGLVLLYVGAEGLVKGTSSLASSYRLPTMLAGLIVTGFGTSTPELLVTLTANWNHYSTLAMANLVGSNLFNTAFILALSLLLQPVYLSSSFRKWDIPCMGACCLLLGWLATNPFLGRGWGAFLLFLFFLYLGITLKITKEKETPSPASSKSSAYLKTALGLIALILGARYFLQGAIQLAEAWHMNQALIGLTIVAIGTSLPELATSLVASYKKQGDIALGNILGSNIYNVLGILGATALMRPIHSQKIALLDLGAMIFCNLLLTLLACFSPVLGKKTGLFLLFSYGIYLFMLFQAQGT